MRGICESKVGQGTQWETEYIKQGEFGEYKVLFIYFFNWESLVEWGEEERDTETDKKRGRGREKQEKRRGT